MNRDSTRRERHTRPRSHTLFTAAFGVMAVSLLCATAAPAKSITGHHGARRTRWQPPSEAVVEDAVEAAVEAAVQDGVKTHLAEKLADRLRDVSDVFLGAPYAVSPLGEGSGQDTDPRMRFDAFDCTTFVETTMALALSSSVGSARRRLDQIRYRDGAPSFLNRRHFPAAEWLPELTRLGYLEDVTRQVGGDDVIVAKKTLNVKVWNQRKRPTVLELPNERIPDGVFVLDVLPLAAARAKQDRIPPGTILNLVRIDRRSVPVRVSHQGLIIERDGKRYMRHAADRMYHSVVDEPLDHFLARMQKYKKWPVAGVHLTQIRQPKLDQAPQSGVGP